MAVVGLSPIIKTLRVWSKLAACPDRSELSTYASNEQEPVQLKLEKHCQVSRHTSGISALGRGRQPGQDSRSSWLHDELSLICSRWDPVQKREGVQEGGAFPRDLTAIQCLLITSLTTEERKGYICGLEASPGTTGGKKNTL